MTTLNDILNQFNLTLRDNHLQLYQLIYQAYRLGIQEGGLKGYKAKEDEIRYDDNELRGLRSLLVNNPDTSIKISKTYKGIQGELVITGPSSGMSKCFTLSLEEVGRGNEATLIHFLETEIYILREELIQRRNLQ